MHKITASLRVFGVAIGFCTGTSLSASQVSTNAYVYSEQGVAPTAFVFDRDDSQVATTISSSADYTGLHINQNYPCCVYETVSGFANSYSDLTTGKLGAIAEGTSLSRTSANAGWSETISFSIAGADTTTQTIIPISMAIDGYLLASEEAYAGVLFTFSLPGAVLQAQKAHNSAWGVSGFGDWTSFSWNAVGDNFFLSKNVVLVGASPTLAIQANLDVHAGSGRSALFDNNYQAVGIADYSHTAAFSWELPTGVTFTSTSGAFLANAGGVPEPATWLMMIGGFGFIGSVSRRKQRHRVAVDREGVKACLPRLGQSERAHS